MDSDKEDTDSFSQLVSVYTLGIPFVLNICQNAFNLQGLQTYQKVKEFVIVNLCIFDT